MNSLVKITIIGFLFFLGKPVLAQQTNSSNRLICKEWRLVSFEEDDGKFEPSPDQIGDRMKLELNHKVEYVEISKYYTGMWRYDPKSKVLTITNDHTKEKKSMKVIKLTNTDFVLEYKNEEGEPIKMYMAAVIRKNKKK